jgi:SAM-dependent methyltransferase
VDIVADLCSEAMPLPMATFGAVLCAETLEHVRDPHRALRNLEMAMRGGAWILITTPFAFPVHNYPDDYWRFTPSGLAVLLEDAGFTDIETHGFNNFTMPLRDHLDDEPIAQRIVPMHVFGKAQCLK